MRYVSVKSAEQQAQSAGHGLSNTEIYLSANAAQLVNALRGHSAEYGGVVAYREGFSSDVSWSILTESLRQTCQTRLASTGTGTALVQELCQACTLSRYPFLMKRLGRLDKEIQQAGQRRMRAHRVS